MLFYVFAYKNTNKHRISLTFSQEKTKTERIEIDFEQKSIPHPYIKVRMGDVHSRYYFPFQAVHLFLHREVQAYLHHLLAAHFESIGIVLCLYLG